VREDAERHGLGPAAHQHRADEAQHQHQPDRAGKGPGDMRAHPQRTRAAEGAQPPQQHRCGHRETGNLPPAAMRQRHKQLEAIFRAGRLERQPRQLPHELDGVPADRRPHVEPDHLKGEETEHQGQDAEPTQINRPDLRIADLAHPIRDAGLADPRKIIAAKRRAHFGRAAQLDLREDVLIACHRTLPPQDQIGRLSHQLHHSGQPRVHKGPEMMMHTALQKPALSARNSPSRWMPSVPTE
ncbi:hypothetical protein CCACVL1_00915, partial [Corchorus capsularis]